MKKTIIIIGNGIAGVSAAQEVVNNRGDEEIDFKIFTSEPWTHYNRPQLPRFIGTKEMEKEKIIGVYDQEWYKKRVIDLHLNEEVLEVDCTKQIIRTSKQEYKFDKLLFATGARCRIPKIEGAELENFYHLRTLSEALEIKEKLEEIKKVSIIGGGILGLELAYQIGKEGKEVTVIEKNSYLLHKQLDEEGSKILQKILEKRGIKFILGKKVKKLEGKEGKEGTKRKVNKIILEDEEEIETELIITCVGIETNKELAEKAGIKVNKGIIVNDYLETSAGENIYAAGDCAEHKEKIYGLWFPAIEQGRIAARNMLKTKKEKYKGSKISTSLKVAEILVTSINYNYKEKIDADEIFKKTEEEAYVKLYLKKDKIKAGLIIGYKKAISIIKKTIFEQLSYKENKEKIMESLEIGR